MFKWFDNIIYRLFYWRWSIRMKNDPELLKFYKDWLNSFETDNS